MIKNILKISKIILINFILLEIICFFIILFSQVPNGVNLMVSAVANKEFSLAHFPDRKYNFASTCWESQVYYNKYGNRKYADNPNAIKIALLGDSMTENAQLSDGEDLGSLLQKKLGSAYEVTNFGIFSTGIYDHLQIYKKKISNKYDILIYFPDPTDITDNHISRNRPNQHMFNVVDDKIIKVPQNDKYWSEYFSAYNQFKRKYGFYIKKYSNTYKVIWDLRERWKYYKNAKLRKKIDPKESIKRLKDPIKVYTHFTNLFLSELYKNNQKFLIIPTLKANIFVDSKYDEYRYNFLKKNWGNNFFYDPYLDAVDYMKSKNIFNYPFLSWKCDSHYSYAGADFYSSFLANKLKIKY